MNSVSRRAVLRWPAASVLLSQLGVSLVSTANVVRARPSSVLTPGTPEQAGFSAELLDDVLVRLRMRVTDGHIPGATALVARRGLIVAHAGFGVKVRGELEPVTTDTLFDLLSMTKVMATAAVTMVLVARGELALDAPVSAMLPEFTGDGKDAVTVRHLLTHTSGLPVDGAFDVTTLRGEVDREAIWSMLLDTPLQSTAGTAVLYSDLGYRLLGRLLEQVTGASLAALAHDVVWAPLGMVDTMFNPPESMRERVAATTYSSVRDRLVRGEVQDELDFALGGIAGCDGVFSTAYDVAVFCQMFLQGGVYEQARIFSTDAAAAMTANQTQALSTGAPVMSDILQLLTGPKGYGWEPWTHPFSHGGSRLAPGAYGKVGGAGTFMWVDPQRQLIAVLLTNHGLPNTIDSANWTRMLDATGSREFFDGVINALDGRR